jgi:DNA processing protein
VIAALTVGTVVVEAAARSGALATARRAHDLGRVLMAVPGPVTSAMSVGAHQMVRERDARLVTCASEVVEEVGRIGTDLAVRPQAPPTVRDALGREADAVLDVLDRRGRSVTEIAVDAGVSVPVTERILQALADAGLVTRSGEGYRIGDDAGGTGTRAVLPPVR